MFFFEILEINNNDIVGDFAYFQDRIEKELWSKYNLILLKMQTKKLS